MVDVSVIICSHNPRPDYLRRALQALRTQTLPLEQWELLLIDNDSKKPVSSIWDISWHPNARHVFEGTLGLAYARRRGILESSAGLLVFVDDDNVLDPDYLAVTLKIGGEWPQLGVWGSGSIEPEFEQALPAYLQELRTYLSLRTHGAIYWSNVPTCDVAMPWGAGLCARATVANAYSQFSTQSAIHIAGRTGAALLSGEDLEIAHAACGMGFGMGVFPALKLLHLISKERITEDYLLRLYEGTFTSNHLLKYKWHNKIPDSPLTILGLLAISANALFRHGIHRRMYFAERRAALTALNIIKRGLK